MSAARVSIYANRGGIEGCACVSVYVRRWEYGYQAGFTWRNSQPIVVIPPALDALVIRR